MIYAKAVTQNPRRDATPDDIARKVLNTDGKECREGDSTFIFPKAFMVPVPQITEANDLEKIYKMKPGTPVPYPSATATAKTELHNLPSADEFVDIINVGLSGYYQRQLQKYANEKKSEVLGLGGKRGRGPADLSKGSIVTLKK